MKITLRTLFLGFWLISLPAHSLSERECHQLLGWDPSLINSLTSMHNTVAQTDGFCPLLNSSEAAHRVEGLSQYWSQEYTGQDLLKSERKLTLPENFIALIDTDFRKHGEHVSGLTAGPHPTSLLYASEPIPYRPMREEGKRDDLVFEEHFKDCEKDQSCPNFIGMSYGWLESESMDQQVKAMREKGITVVTSAGNEGERIPTEPKKTLAASKDDIILVGNAGFTGDPYYQSSPSPFTHISVPSGNEIISYDFQAKQSVFGGTSAGQPQVTAALAGFELITGEKLENADAIKILEKTALPHPHLPNPSSAGPGLLNTYAIGKLAEKVKEICQSSSNKLECIAQNLKDDSLFQLKNEEKEKEILEASEAVFPGCRQTQSRQLGHSCNYQRGVFTALRKAAFLNPRNPLLWEKLACLHEQAGFSMNKEYYSNLADGVRKSDEEKIEELKRRNKKSFIKHVLSHPNWMEKYKEDLKKEITETRYSKDLFSFVLSQPGSVQFKEEILAMIQTKKSLSNMNLFLKAPHWAQHPEVILTYVKRINESRPNDKSYFKSQFSEVLETPAIREKFEDLLKEKTGKATAATYLNITRYLL